MSVNFDPVDSNLPPAHSLVQSSSSSSCSSPKKLTSVCKLIAFPNNHNNDSASSSSLSVNDSYYNKKHHQLNDQREYLDNCTFKHCRVSSSSSSSSPSSSVDSMGENSRKSLDKSYSTINDTTDNRLDQEWCSARKRQLDEILIKLQQLRKVNLDDRENIEGMKKKTIKLIATYSSITMKTNNFLTRWERKYGSKLKAIQAIKPSSSSSSSPSCSSPSPTSPFSPNIYDEKFEPNYLFNSTPIW